MRTRALILTTFLTLACGLPVGGLIGMLALNGIFVLVTQHGLEYPKFYTRLYALLEPDAFQVRRSLAREHCHCWVQQVPVGIWFVQDLPWVPLTPFGWHWVA